MNDLIKLILLKIFSFVKDSSPAISIFSSDSILKLFIVHFMMLFLFKLFCVAKNELSIIDFRDNLDEDKHSDLLLKDL